MVLLRSKAMAIQLVAFVATVGVWASQFVLKLVSQHRHHDGLVFIQVEDIQRSVVVSVTLIVPVGVLLRALRLPSRLWLQAPRRLRLHMSLLFGLLCGRVQVGSTQDVVELYVMLRVRLLNVHRVLSLSLGHWCLDHVASNLELRGCPL